MCRKKSKVEHHALDCFIRHATAGEADRLQRDRLEEELLPRHRDLDVTRLLLVGVDAARDVQADQTVDAAGEQRRKQLHSTTATQSTYCSC